MIRAVMTPPGTFDVTVRVPGSKSIMNRALVAAALAPGVSTLDNSSRSDDSFFLSGALQQVGIRINTDGNRTTVHGRGGVVGPSAARFDMGNAGTALRFFTSVACLGDGSYTIDGDTRMRERPIQGLADTLTQLGAEVRTRGGCPPVEIHTRAGLTGGPVTVEGTISSQFLSSVLLVAPYAKKEIRIQVRGGLTSKPYVKMTLRVMKDFGVDVAWDDASEFRIPVGAYRPLTYDVEGDAASANYFLAMAAAAGGRARVEGISRDSRQGESAFLDILTEMGCEVGGGNDHIEVRGGTLRGVDVDMNGCPDSAQTLAVLALFAEGPTRIRNVANLRVKETDRIQALLTELPRLGARVVEYEDGLEVHPPGTVKEAEIETYDDHRMAMSFAVVGAVRPVTIRNPGVVNKSYPGFFDVLQSFGMSRIS